MAANFNDRAQDMGLEIEAHRGLYKYSDLYGEVIYRSLWTAPSGIPNEDPHLTDNFMVPMMAIFTKAPEWNDYRYVGYVSNLYKFIGNNVLNQRIRESIESVGMPIVTENTIMSADHARMRNEIIIQNGQNIANVGDVLPVMIVGNSYNGTRAASVAFGMRMSYGQTVLTFGFDLGEIRQVHIANSTTRVASAINEYMQAFNEGIAEMISSSFERRLTEDNMLTTLDVIEDQFGKRKRESISTMLDEMTGEEDGFPSAWQMFLAIVRYSSFEPNLNVKRMMESAAESVLIIPQRMYEVLNQLQNS